MKTIATTLVLATIFSFSAAAETRTWTDVYGRKIQAEMVENMDGHITLLMENGKETHVKISALSAADQKYVLKNTPPKIEIQVSESTDRENQGFSFRDAEDSSISHDRQVQTSTSQYKITLKKSGTIPYEKPIHAEFYLIGFKKETEEFVLLDKTIKRVSFGKDDDSKFVFESDSVTVKNLQGGAEKGTELFGHLVVLVDEQNRVFDAKGSRAKIVEHTARIRKRPEGFAIKKADLQSADNRLK